MSRLSVLSNPVDEVAQAGPGIGTRVTNAAFSGLGTIGHILDTVTGASTLRAIINTVQKGGDDWERIFTGIIDPSQTVSGTELLGGDPDKFTWGGLAAEVFLDPGTYLTFGAKTAVGQLAKQSAKLGAQEAAQQAVARAGSAGAARRLAQTTAKKAEVEEQLAKAGRDRGEVLASSIRDQFGSGQRALVQLDLPFTRIQKTLIGHAATGRVVGTAADHAALVATSNPVSKELREKFVTRRKNPIEEELRKEINREVRGLSQRARVSGQELAKQRLLLQAKDPDVDLKIIRVLEEADDALDIPLAGIKASNPAMPKMLKARLNVEQLYGQTDNFDDIWAFAQQVRKLNKELLGAEQAAGVAVTPFNEFGYVARILTPSGAALLRESKKGRESIIRHFNKLDVGSPGAFQQARTFDQLGIDNLNKELAEIYGKDPASFKFFDTDVVSIQVNRMLDSAKQIGRARFAQAAVDLFGVERSKKLIDSGVQIGAEKLISPKGPLVTNMRLNLDLSAAKLAEYLVKRRVPTEAIGRTGVRIAGYDFANITDEVVEKAYEFRTKKAFYGTKNNPAISPEHSLLDEAWTDLVREGAITDTQHRFLRTFFAQVPAEKIRDLNVGVTRNPRVNGSYNPIQKSLRLTNNPTESQVRPVHTFLHEFGHAFHLSYLSKADKAKADAALAKLVNGVDDRTLIDLTGGEYERVLRNYQPAQYQNELFAIMFSRFMQGTRTTDATLDKIFKNMSDQYKDFRDSVFTNQSLITSIASQGKVGATALNESIDLADLFMGAIESNAKILDRLPGSPRKSLMTDLLDPVHTRRGFVDIPPNATEKEVREALLEAGVERTALPAEIADFAEQMLGHSKYHLDSDKWWAKTIRAFDEIHSIYRTAFTQYFPAFHSRNAISNVFMNAMAGDVGIKHYVRAMNQIRQMDPEEALYLASLGVLDSGKIREVFELMQDSRGGITDAMKRMIAKLPGDQHLAKVGSKTDDFFRNTVGHGIENHTRLAHYLAKKDAGFTDADAADSVIKYLFDYQDLTDFERAVPRRAMLFYTFFRKNLPLMLQESFQNPRFMQLYARATGQNNQNIAQPDWLPDGFFFGEDEQGRSIRLNFGLPPEDLARFDPEGKGLARVAELMISNLVPVIREPFQFVSGKDLFTGRPREGGPGEIALSNLPTARATGTARRLQEALVGEDPNLNFGAEFQRFFTGMAIRPIDEDVQKKMNQLDKVRDRLDELVRAGRGRKIEIVGQRKDREPDPEVQMLNSIQSQILRDLARSRDR